jgi:excalibur calcium-binding domain-containing protein
MRKLIVLATVGLLGWYGYNKYQAQVRAEPPPQSESRLVEQPTRLTVQGEPPLRTTFRCDGRTHCSQMRSCDEATYFLRNCPGVKMDGDNDGVPCEQQLCRVGR